MYCKTGNLFRIIVIETLLPTIGANSAWMFLAVILRLLRTQVSVIWSSGNAGPSGTGSIRICPCVLVPLECVVNCRLATVKLASYLTDCKAHLSKRNELGPLFSG